MEKTMGKEYGNAAQREQFLKDNCDTVEEKGYMKPFTRNNCRDTKKSWQTFQSKFPTSKWTKKKRRPNINHV